MGTQVLQQMANYIKAINADIVIIMEVRLVEEATEAVKQIQKLLGKKDWDILVTSNNSTAKPDRYGLLWRKAKVGFIGQSWLDKDTSGNVIDYPNRYPSLFQFHLAPMQWPLSLNYRFSIIVLHGPNPGENKGKSAIEAMSKMLRFSDVQKPPFPTIISGDFNVDYNDNSTPYDAFTEYGYQVLLNGQRTSLKFKFNTKDDLYGEYLKSAYDNIMISKELQTCGPVCNVFDFVGESGEEQDLPDYMECDEDEEDQWQTTLTECRRVSDHLAVYITLNLPPPGWTPPSAPPQ